MTLHPKDKGVFKKSKFHQNRISFVSDKETGNQKVFLTNSLNQYVLKEPLVERDLGMMILSDLKLTEQVNLSVSKANRSIGTLKNVFTNLEVSSFNCL